MKKFCIAGPIDPTRHYFIPNRLTTEEIYTFIEDREYFVLHAPRQSGKTSSIDELAKVLTQTGKYVALYINVEAAQAARDNVEKALISIIVTLKFAIQNTLNDNEETVAHLDDIINQRVPTTLNILQLALSFLAKHTQKPIVLFIDEIDSLIDKLKEERVYPIIDAVIEGCVDAVNFDRDAVQYVRDLGLLKPDAMAIANPIYQEIIPRELTTIISEALAEKYVLRPGYIQPDGSLNMEALLGAFYEFYRDNSSIWLEQFEYKESGPHLLLMAFLQRIINGGGTIFREYALGRGRVDLLIQWQKQRIVLELKVKHRKMTLQEGLEQTSKYMDTSSATEGYLIIFDRDPKKTWSQKYSQEKMTFQNHTISVWQI